MDTTKIASYEEVETLARNLNEKADKMRTLLENVKRLYEEIGSEGTWAGASADVVSKNVEALGANFDKLYGAIQGCSEFMTSSIKSYRAVDEEINVTSA